MQNGSSPCSDGTRRTATMSTSCQSSAAKLLLAFAGVNSLALLIASIALLAWVTESEDGGPVAPASDDPAVAFSDSLEPARNGNRFTLRLGQGFRFRDGAVVVAKQDETADVVFKYLPPQVGGMALRYNEISQQVETGLEPTLTSPVPLLVGTHIQPFDRKPDVARITSGDAATYGGNAPITGTTRFVLLINPAGDQYLLTLDELEAVPGKYDEWRIGFGYEKVQLPVGLAGGRINKPLPGKLIFRDWYRSEVIVAVDLTTGKEERLADGIL